MWMYRTAARDGPPIVLYEYQATRSGEHPRKFLCGFRGYLHADGYAGYNGLCEITEPDKPQMVYLCGCWTHFRRKFDEALKAQPPGKRQTGRAKEAIVLINQLFLIERNIKKSEPAQRLAARQEKSRPLVDGIRNWLERLKGEVLPKSMLGAAVTYGMNQWEKLTRFLEDERIDLSNNLAERGIKPFVIGRKNFLFWQPPETHIFIFELKNRLALNRSVYILDFRFALECSYNPVVFTLFIPCFLSTHCFLYFRHSYPAMHTNRFKLYAIFLAVTSRLTRSKP